MDKRSFVIDWSIIEVAYTPQSGKWKKGKQLFHATSHALSDVFDYFNVVPHRRSLTSGGFHCPALPI